jgi:hypothetical protein
MVIDLRQYGEDVGRFNVYRGAARDPAQLTSTEVGQALDAENMHLFEPGYFTSEDGADEGLREAAVGEALPKSLTGLVRDTTEELIFAVADAKAPTTVSDAIPKLKSYPVATEHTNRDVVRSHGQFLQIEGAYHPENDTSKYEMLSGIAMGEADRGWEKTTQAAIMGPGRENWLDFAGGLIRNERTTKLTESFSDDGEAHDYTALTIKKGLTSIRDPKQRAMATAETWSGTEEE